VSVGLEEFDVDGESAESEPKEGNSEVCPEHHSDYGVE
jgi:hypothetical protein